MQDDQRPGKPAAALGLRELHSKASLSLVDRFKVPPHLLPGEGMPEVLRQMAVLLQGMAHRRLRLLGRMGVAASAIAQQASLLMEYAADGAAPPAHVPPLHPADLQAVTTTSARVTELEDQINLLAGALVEAAEAMMWTVGVRCGHGFVVSYGTACPAGCDQSSVEAERGKETPPAC